MFAPAAMISASTCSNRATNASSASRSVKSSRCAVTPSSAISRRAAACTVSPCAANARAVSRPMPEDAPMTTTVLLTSGARQEDLELGRRRALGEPREGVRAVLERTHRGEVVAELRLAGDEPLMGLVEVGHRVGVGALDAVLRAHDVVEAERRGVVGQADADHRPARAQQLQAEPARRL